MREIRLFGHHVNLSMLLLAAIDISLVGGALYVSADDGMPAKDRWVSITLALIGCTAVFVGKFAVGLYHHKIRATFSAIVVRTAVAFLFAAPLLMIAGILLPIAPVKLAWVFISGISSYALIAVVQAGYFVIADTRALKRRVLVLGADARALTLRSMRRRADRRGFDIVGFVPFGEGEEKAEPLVNIAGSLADYAVANKIGEIVVAMGERRNRLPVDELTACRFAGVAVTDLSLFMEREAGKVPLDLLRPGWMVFDGNPATRFFEFSKRLLDIVGALVLLTAFLPVMIAASIAIKREEGWRAPLFYRQTRVGAGGKTFELVKFRSMRVDAESDGKAVWASRNDDRVTNVGRILRKTRVDEIPQLFNVLRGSMSLVGPRPERPPFVAELEKCIPFYSERHRIKPGVTGWAQLMYPYGASREDAKEKLQYDLYYVKNRSVLLDLIILVQTVEVVLFGKGAR